MNTSEIKELSPEQIKAFEKAFQQSMDKQFESVFGVSPKFNSTFVWPIPAPEKETLIAGLRINCV